MNAFEIQQEVWSWMQNVPPNATVAQWEKGVLIGLMNLALKPQPDEKRHKALAWLFRDILERPSASVISSKELTEDMWWALARWADIYHDDDSKQWRANNGFDEKIRECWQATEDWEREMNQQLGFPDML